MNPSMLPLRTVARGLKTEAILDEIKPEAVYFTEMNGQQTLIMIVELEKSSAVPKLAEPWFLTFNADSNNYSKPDHF